MLCSAAAASSSPETQRPAPTSNPSHGAIEASVGVSLHGGAHAGNGLNTMHGDILYFCWNGHWTVLVL